MRSWSAAQTPRFLSSVSVLSGALEAGLLFTEHFGHRACAPGSGGEVTRMRTRHPAGQFSG
jgi:hypothetical protein